MVCSVRVGMWITTDDLFRRGLRASQRAIMATLYKLMFTGYARRRDMYSDTESTTSITATTAYPFYTNIGCREP